SVARRVLSAGQVSLFQDEDVRVDRKDYATAAAELEVASVITPGRPGIFYELARVYSLAREKKKALESLKKAVESGFTNADAIEKDASFAPLRGEAEYGKIIK